MWSNKLGQFPSHRIDFRHVSLVNLSTSRRKRQPDALSPQNAVGTIYLTI